MADIAVFANAIARRGATIVIYAKSAFYAEITIAYFRVCSRYGFFCDLFAGFPLAGSCVGLYNHRYYIVTIFYCLCAALYGSYFNLFYSLELYSSYEVWQMVLIFLFPLFSFVVRAINFHQFIVSLGTLVCCCASMLLLVLGVFHVKLMMLNRTVHENAHDISLYSHRSPIINVQAVLGSRYILVWLWPLVRSR